MIGINYLIIFFLSLHYKIRYKFNIQYLYFIRQKLLKHCPQKILNTREVDKFVNPVLLECE